MPVVDSPLANLDVSGEDQALDWMAAEQEEYIKEEQRSLKRELLRAQEEVKRIQSVPLVIGQFLEMVDGNSGIVGSTTGAPEPLTRAERPGFHHTPRLVSGALTGSSVSMHKAPRLSMSLQEVNSEATASCPLNCITALKRT